MPAALEAHHRSLIYRTSRHDTLLNEPGVKVTMDDGEEIKLEPMHAFDKPNKKDTIKIGKILGNTTDQAAWNNLTPFLHGVVLAKVRLPASFYERVTRKACEIGKERIILHCAENPDETSVSLAIGGVAKELMLGFHGRAVDADFKGPELEAADRRAEKLKRMLEDQMHGHGKLNQGEVDARSDPLVLSVFLELAAARAVDNPNSKDHKDRAANYATKLLHLDRNSLKPRMSVNEQSRLLRELLPMQNGIKWALKIDSISKSDLGKKLRDRLQAVTKDVESVVEKLRKTGKDFRGLLMYDELDGRKNMKTKINAARESQDASREDSAPGASKEKTNVEPEQAGAARL